MNFATDPIASEPRAGRMAEAFVLLVAAAWFVAPGFAIALACYGALLVSQILCALCRSASTRPRALVGLALTWLVVLTLTALALPSNFSRAMI